MDCLKYLIVVWICFKHSVANIAVPTDQNLTQDRIIYSGIEIANKNFNFRKLTTILSKDIDDKFVDKFLQFYEGSVVVETNKQPASQVVIIIESYNSFLKSLAKLKPDLDGKTLLSSGAKILILLSESNKIESITKVLWSYHAINALIITSNNSTIAMYTYYPYTDYFNCQNTKPYLIGNWKENTLGKFMYTDKIKNMNGCPLYISTNKLYHPDTEQKIPLQIIKKTMIRLLRDVMNFTPIVSTRDYVSIDSDRAKNWSDSLNDVITGVANISTCSIPLGIDTLGLLDYSGPYFRVRLAWLAPPVTPGPVWWRLLSPLNGYLWLILLVFLFVVTALPFALNLRVVKKFSYRYFRNINKLHGVPIRVWGVMLGQPIRVFPNKFRDFYIISLWMWFTFVIRSAYQSVLIGALKTDTLIGNFADLEETIENGYRYGGKAGVFAHFEHDQKIIDNFEIIPEEKFEQIFHDVIEGRQKFVLATSLEYAWAYCLSQGKKEDECGQVLLDSIMMVPLVVWMKIHSPFLRPLSVWLPRLMESGLLERDSIKKPPCCILKSSDPTPLNRHQTLSCLLCLLFGYTISFVVFGLEVIRRKTRNLKHILNHHNYR